MRGLVIQLPTCLLQDGELWLPMKGVERQYAVFVWQVQVGWDDRRFGGTLSLFAGEFRVDLDGWFLAATALLLFPAMGRVQVDQVERDFLLLTGPLGGAIHHVAADNAIVQNDLIGAVLHVEARALEAIAEFALRRQLRACLCSQCNGQRSCCGGGDEQCECEAELSGCEHTTLDAAAPRSVAELPQRKRGASHIA